MSQLQEILARLHRHEGVQHVLLLGRDGLLIRHLSQSAALDVDTVAAMIPGLAAACSALGHSTGHGDFATAVLEFGSGVAIVVSLSDELLLTLLLQPGIGFAPLLREVREQRDRLAELI